MKKLLFVLSLITVQSFGQLINITSSSFSQSTSISLGSSQWVDVQVYNTNPYLDSLKLYLFENKTKGTFYPTKTILFKQCFHCAVGSQNNGFIKDSSGGMIQTRYRIYFKIPSEFPSGYFTVTTLTGKEIQGNIEVTTGLNYLDYSSSEQIKEVFYYNLNGVKIENPDNYDGVLIKKELYNNQMVVTKKLYFSKNN